MARSSSVEADKLIDVELPVLNKGFVKLIDYMGTDDRIVQAAAMSYGNDAVKDKEGQTKIINHMLRNGHTSPFEQVVLTFVLKMPVFVARQWVRHRTARMNEQSARYAEVQPGEFYVPTTEDIIDRIATNHVNYLRDRATDPGELQDMLEYKTRTISSMVSTGSDRAYNEYMEMMHSHGAPRELARTNLQLGMYTTFMWQIDLNNLIKFIQLRTDTHAQLEIRKYADLLYHCAKAVAPIAMAAADEFVIGSTDISQTELTNLCNLLENSDITKDHKDLVNLTKRLVAAQRTNYIVRTEIAANTPKVAK